MTEKPTPTPAELAILQVLWACGPSTVREVHHEVAKTQPTGYTTVLKFLQIMTDKGLVTRDESQRAHVYAAAMDEREVQEDLVGNLLERAFGGSTKKLILRALSYKRSSPEELTEIRNLLDRLEGGHE